MILKISVALLFVGAIIALEFGDGKPTFDVLVGHTRFSRSLTYAVGKNCTKEGLMCENCTTLTYCQDFGDYFEKHEGGDCSNTSTCHDSTAECSESPNPSCDADVVGFKFTCKQSGAYPHPFDCFKGYFCESKAGATAAAPTTYTAIEISCTGKNFSYNPLSAMCNKKLVNGTCENFVSQCTKVGDSTVIKGNNQLYSKCLLSPATDSPRLLVPYMFACNGDFVYNVTKCVDPSTLLPTPPPSAVDANNNCLATGLFPDPTSCKYYLNCQYEKRAPLRTACPTGTRYNAATKKCVDFVC